MDNPSHIKVLKNREYSLFIGFVFKIHDFPFFSKTNKIKITWLRLVNLRVILNSSIRLRSRYECMGVFLGFFFVLVYLKKQK